MRTGSNGANRLVRSGRRSVRSFLGWRRERPSRSRSTPPGRPGSAGRRISQASLAATTSWVAASLWLEPENEARAALHSHVVFALGYGHLLASVVRGRRPASAQPPRAAAAKLGTLATLATGYAAYVELCQFAPALPLGLLALSAWHTVENDRALRRSSPEDALPIAALSTRRSDLFADAAIAAGLSLLALAAPHLSPRIDATDVIAAVTLHHLVSWLILIVARARARGRLRSELIALLRLHAPTLALCLGAMAVLGAPSAWPASIVDVSRAVLSPATYLFWSAAHVVHTAWRRARP